MFCALVSGNWLCWGMVNKLRWNSCFSWDGVEYDWWDILRDTHNRKNRKLFLTDTLCFGWQMLDLLLTPRDSRYVEDNASWSRVTSLNLLLPLPLRAKTFLSFYHGSLVSNFCFSCFALSLVLLSCISWWHPLTSLWLIVLLIKEKYKRKENGAILV